MSENNENTTTTLKKLAPADDIVERVAKALALDMYPDVRWPRDERDANSGVDDRQGRYPISWHYAEKCRSQARVAIRELSDPPPTPQMVVTGEMVEAACYAVMKRRGYDWPSSCDEEEQSVARENMTTALTAALATTEGRS